MPGTVVALWQCTRGLRYAERDWEKGVQLLELTWGMADLGGGYFCTSTEPDIFVLSQDICVLSQDICVPGAGLGEGDPSVQRLLLPPAAAASGGAGQGCRG
eukprot:3326828-Rhodomonas_salina.1